MVGAKALTLIGLLAVSPSLFAAGNDEPCKDGCSWEATSLDAARELIISHIPREHQLQVSEQLQQKSPEFSFLAAKLIQRVYALCYEEAVYQRDPVVAGRILAGLAAVPEKSYGDFQQFFESQFRTGYSRSGASWLIRAMGELPPAHYAQVGQHLAFLMKTGCDTSQALIVERGSAKAQLFAGFVEIKNLADIPAVVSAVLRYTTPTLSFSHRAGLLKSFARVPCAQHESFMIELAPLMEKISNENDRCWSIKFLTIKYQSGKLSIFELKELVAELGTLYEKTRTTPYAYIKELEKRW